MRHLRIKYITRQISFIFTYNAFILTQIKKFQPVTSSIYFTYLEETHSI